MTSSPLNIRMMRGSFWVLAGNAISRGTVLFTAIVVARIIGPKSFGEFAILQNTIGMFGVLGGFGLGLTATKHVADYRDTSPERASRLLAFSISIGLPLGLATTLILVLLAPILASGPLAASHLTEILRIYSPVLVLGSVSGVLSGGLAGFERFRTIAVINLLAGLVTLPAVFLLTRLSGLKGTVLGLVAGAAFSCALLYLATKKEIRHRGLSLKIGRWQRDDFKIIYKFSLPAFLSSILLMPVTWLCATILVARPDGYYELGVFNAANQWRTAGLFIPNAVISSFLPVMANLLSNKKYEEFRKTYRNTITFNILFAILATILIIPMSGLIMSAYGKGFASGSIVLRVLAVVIIIDALTNLTATTLIASGKIWRHLILFSVWGVTLILITLVTTPKYGALGLAISYVVAQFIYACFLSIYMRTSWFLRSSETES